MSRNDYGEIHLHITRHRKNSLLYRSFHTVPREHSMSTPSTALASSENGLSKVLTGIQGLDEITEGGLPQGRPTLVCGSAGSGKTLLSMEFLVRGAMEYNEPGVFMAFEETAEELAKNVRSLEFDLDRLVADKKLRLDYVRVERSEIEETGEYDLEGLFGNGQDCDGQEPAGGSRERAGRALKIAIAKESIRCRTKNRTNPRQTDRGNCGCTWPARRPSASKRLPT
jgi:hypothetical protein